MKKGLFTLFALILTLSAILGLSLVSNAADVAWVGSVVVYDGTTWTPKASIGDAVADADAEFVGGKYNVENIDVVAVVDDCADYVVDTDTIVAIAVKDGVDANITSPNHIKIVTTKTVTFNGETFTANVYVNTNKVRAAVDKTFYYSVQDAVDAASDLNGLVQNVEALKNNPVVVFGNGSVNVTTNNAVAIVGYNGATVTTPNTYYFSYEVNGVVYEGNTYDSVYAVVNTNKYKAVVGRKLFTSVQTAINYAVAANGEIDALEDIKQNPVVVFGTAPVVVGTTPATNVTNKAVAIVAYDGAEVQTSSSYFKYQATANYEGESYTAYAVINTDEFIQALVVDRANSNKVTLYATVAEAVAAAKTNDIDAITNKVVVALKNVTVDPAWFGGANMVAIVGAEGVTVNTNGIFTYTKTGVSTGVDFVGTVNVHAVVNAEAILVETVGNNKTFTLYSSVAAAIGEAKTNNIDAITNKVVVAFKNVTVDPAWLGGANMVAIVGAEGVTVNTNGIFTYTKTGVDSGVDFVGTVSAYAVVNAEAIVVDRSNGNKVTLYATVADAVNAAKTNDIKKATNKAVVVLKKGDVTVTVPAGELVAVAPYNNETTLNFGNVFTYSKDVTVNTEVLSGTVTVTAVVNAKAIVVDRTNGNAIELYGSVAGAINAASTNDIEKITDKVVIVLEEGNVPVAIPVGKMVAITTYDNATDLQFTDGVFTYSQSVAVDTDFVSGTFTVYAAVAAEAIVIDINKSDIADINSSNIADIVANNIKFFANIDDAIAAADGKLTSAVVVLKKGVVAPVVNDFVFLGAIDAETTFNKAGYFTFDVELEYAGFDITAIAVYNTDYIFGGTADAITTAFPAVNATYTGTEFNIEITSENIFELTSAEYYTDILVHFAPLFVLGDYAEVNNYVVYNGRQVQVSELVEAIVSCVPTLAELENIDKNVFSVDLKIGSAGTYETFTLNFILEMSEAKLEKIRDAAATVNKCFDLDTVDGKVIFAIDARPIVDIIFEKELTKGKTIKEVRDFVNKLSINAIAELVEGYNLTGKKAKAAELFVKAVDKVGESKYASYLDITIGMFDLDKTGDYKVAMSYTINLGTKIENAVNKFNAKFPSIAQYVTFDQFANINSITVAFDGTITVFDVYTVTFVDANENVIYTESLLEGETPVFTGDAPIKETDSEYTYTFAGWTDGVNEYTGELAPITKDTTYAPVFDKAPLEEEEEELKFFGGTVSFEDSFKLNMYIEVSKLAGYDSFWVTANGTTINADEDEEGNPIVYAVDSSKGVVECYRFSVDDIAAKEIGNLITFVIKAQIGTDINESVIVTGETKDYSVKAYAMNIINNPDKSAAMKRLCVDALVYAAEAQKVLIEGVADEDLVTNELTDAQKALGTQVAPTLENRFNLDVTANENSEVKLHGASLIYECNVVLNIILDLKDRTPDTMYAVITSHGGAVETVILGDEFEANGSYYTFKFDQYAAKEFDQDIEVTIYDIDTDEAISTTLTYGAEAYACRMIEVGKDVNLVNSFMNYVFSAKAYFEA